MPFFVKILKSYTPLTQVRMALTLVGAVLILIGCEPLGTSTPPSDLTVTPVTGGLYEYHNDDGRTGRNLSETVLTRDNVNQAKFGKIASLIVDGQVYAQPLVANGVTYSNGIGPRNLLFVATENDSVYAFDISDPTSLKQAWKQNFNQNCGQGNVCSNVKEKERRVAAAKLKATLVAADSTVSDIQVNAPNISPQVGITATPVIDPDSQTIYVTAMSEENGNYLWKLHALSLATGKEQSGSPVLINGSYPGNGLGSNNGVIAFQPIMQLSRAGLVLTKDPVSNGKIVTVAFTTFDDNEPSHGWIFSYSSSTLGLAGLWMTTPGSGDGSIWQAGGAPAVDTDGSLIFATANGDSDPQYANMNPPSWGDSVLKIKMLSSNFGSPTSAYPMAPVDFFTPSNHASLDINDVEVGSGGVLLLPGSDSNLYGTNTRLMVAGGKQGTIYLLNRDDMSGLSATPGDPRIVQELAGKLPGGGSDGSGIYGTPSYYNGRVYIAAAGDFLRSIPFSNGQLNWNGMQATTQKIALRGATASISGSNPLIDDGIIWYLDASAYTYTWNNPQTDAQTRTNGSAVLYAYNTDDLSLLYSSPVNNLSGPLASTQNGDNCTGVAGAAGCAVKFAVPTVQNGMVFVGTDTEVSVYGLLNQTPQASQQSGH